MGLGAEIAKGVAGSTGMVVGSAVPGEAGPIVGGALSAGLAFAVDYIATQVEAETTWPEVPREQIDDLATEPAKGAEMASYMSGAEQRAAVVASRNLRAMRAGRVDDVDDGDELMALTARTSVSLAEPTTTKNPTRPLLYALGAAGAVVGLGIGIYAIAEDW